jgi:hypothetical protein
MLRPGAAALVVGAVVAAAVGLAGEVEPAAAPEPVAVSVPVEQATLVCPGVASVQGVSTAVVSAAAPVVGPGTLRLDVLGADPAGAPLATAPAGASTLRYQAPVGASRTLVLRGTGTLAQGLTGTVATRAESGAGRGLFSVACTPPAADRWFVGAGALVGERASIHLANVDAAPAAVDVVLYGSKGPQRPTAAQGVLVAPGAQVVLPVDALVPGEAATAIHVVTRSGRVSSAVLDTQVAGLDPRGLDWVPAAAAPATTVVVPGVPGDGDARRTLQLVAPGESDATVQVRLVTTEGTIAPVGLETLEVPAGQLFSLALDEIAATGPFAVQLDADQPIVAGVRIVRAPSGAIPDVAFAAGAPALAGPAVVTEAPRTGTVTTTLLLSATGAADAVVSVAGAKAGEPLTGALSVTVPAGQTLAVALGSAAGPWMVVTPVAGTGSVHAGWVRAEAGARGPLLTAQPLASAPVSVEVPAARPDPAAGFAGRGPTPAGPTPAGPTPSP